MSITLSRFTILPIVQIHVPPSNKNSLERSLHTKSTGVYMTSLVKTILSNDGFFSLKNRRRPSFQYAAFPYSRNSSYVEDATQAGDPSPEDKPDGEDENKSTSLESRGVVTNGSVIPWACIVLFIFRMNLPALARSYVPHDTFITWSLAAFPVFGVVDAPRCVISSTSAAKG